MSDEYQTRQFFNMRPETTIKLKRIIKEEIRSAIKEGVLGDEDAENQFMKNLISKAGGELSRSEKGNQFRKKTYEVGYKYYAGDDYEWDTVEVEATSPEEAIKKVKNREVSGVPRTASDIAIVEPKNEEFKRMQKFAGLINEEYSSDFKVGDKVKFDAKTLYKMGFEDSIKYYEDLTGVVAMAQHYDIMGNGTPTDILHIDLNKPIHPPGGYIGNSEEESEHGMYEITLVKSEGDFDMITKI
jgi:hypothetical protein